MSPETETERLTKALVAAELENAALRARIGELSSGIALRGWWCICDAFNGEEHSPRIECRSCGKPKIVHPMRHA